MISSGVSIRPIKITDTKMIVKWRNSEHIKHNFIYRETLTEEAHISWYENKVLTGEVAQFIIESPDFGGGVGSVYLRNIDKINQKSEFGIFIGEKDAVNKRIGTQATKLTLKYAFENLLLNKVFLRILAHNHIAIRTYQKVGFNKIGTFKKDVRIEEKYYDVMFMEILKDEYLEINKD